MKKQALSYEKKNCVCHTFLSLVPKNKKYLLSEIKMRYTYTDINQNKDK